MDTDDFCNQPVVVGDTTTFEVIVEKDGAVWDITAAAVNLYLQDPSGNVLGPYAATITDGPNGKADYTVGTTILSVAGDWIKQWHITASGISIWSKEIVFSVLPKLA